MKRVDDDLLRLAFGELSAQSARAAEARASADASVQRQLDELRELRADLQNLPSPPPDTLSVERLRTAILDRDLRARRPAPFVWSWAPVAALAACAAFMLVSRHRATPQGPVPIIAPTATFAMKSNLDAKPEGFNLGPVPRFQPLLPKGAESLPVKASSTPVGEASRVVVRHRHRRRATEISPPPDVAKTPDGSPEEGARLVAFKQPETIVAPTSSVVDEAPGGVSDAMRSRSSTASGTVVVLSAKRDLDTGAQAATETEASNVLVGG